jgi:hypothetical protein
MIRIIIFFHFGHWRLSLVNQGHSHLRAAMGLCVRVIRILGGDGEKSLAIRCVVALSGTQVDSSRDTFFVSMAIGLHQHHSLLNTRDISPVDQMRLMMRRHIFHHAVLRSDDRGKTPNQRSNVPNIRQSPQESLMLTPQYLMPTTIKPTLLPKIQVHGRKPKGICPRWISRSVCHLPPRLVSSAG